MNYNIGSVVTIDNEDYKIVPPRNLTATCDGCDFRIPDNTYSGHCGAPDKLPCTYPSRIYKKVTDQHRDKEKKTFKNFIKYIINN